MHPAYYFPPLFPLAYGLQYDSVLISRFERAKAIEEKVQL